MADLPKKKHRLGDRHDARKLRSLPPMQYVMPFLMKDRCDAQNFFTSSIDCDYLEDYIRQKREEGLVGFGLMHIIVAGYVRMVASYPGINRYIAGQRIFSRDEIVISMMVKKEMKLNAQESAIKVRFLPSDTVYDVYNKINEQIKVATAQGDTNGFDNIARLLVKLPTLVLRGFVGLMKAMDYFGIMPRIIDEVSPCHASMFISNLGSLGIPPIYHHIYNFGNISVFITFGAKKKELKLNADGTVSEHYVVDYTVVTDERIADGHYFANAFKGLQKIFHNPQKLDTPPEKVVYDVD